VVWRNPQLGEELTTTERMLVEELAKDGESNKTIALKVGKPVSTVKSHLLAASRKLGVTNRNQLLVRWLRREEEQDMKFVEFLETTLIVDLKDTGMDATAEDFEECCHIIRRLYGQG